MWKKCKDCEELTQSDFSLRCIKCKSILRKNTQKKNKDKYQYHKKPKHRYATYKRGAISRGYSFDISYELFLSLWNLPCHYCGESIEGIGLDRKDNTIGYTKDNTISCCTECNFMKGKIDYDAFINRCIKISFIQRV